MTRIDEPEFLWDDTPLPPSLCDDDGHPILELDLDDMESDPVEFPGAVAIALPCRRISQRGRVQVGTLDRSQPARSFWMIDYLRDENFRI